MIALVAISLAAIAQEPGAFTPSPAPLDSTSLPELPPRRAPAQVDDAQARKIAQQFSTCAARSSFTTVGSFLTTFPSSKEERKQAKILISGKARDCVKFGEITFAGSLRGALYEATYHRDYGAEGPTDFAAVAAIDYGSGSGSETVSDPAPAVALRLFADCAVRTDGVAARALVMSPIAEPAEREALRALLPALKACLPTDRALTFSLTSVRGLVAETLYRLSEKLKGTVS